MTGSAPIIRAAGQGDHRSFLGGGHHTWKLLAEDTGGAFFMFEDVMTGGKTTPWHQHPEADETVYVLEGEILVNVDGNETRLGAGRTVLHAARCATRIPCRLGPGTVADPADPRDRPGVLPGRERGGGHDGERRHRSPQGIGDGEPPRRRAARTAPLRHVTTRRELDRPVAGTTAGVAHPTSHNGQYASIHGSRPGQRPAFLNARALRRSAAGRRSGRRWPQRSGQLFQVDERRAPRPPR